LKRKTLFVAVPAFALHGRVCYFTGRDEERQQQGVTMRLTIEYCSQ